MQEGKVHAIYILGPGRSGKDTIANMFSTAPSTYSEKQNLSYCHISLIDPIKEMLEYLDIYDEEKTIEYRRLLKTVKEAVDIYDDTLILKTILEQLEYKHHDKNSILFVCIQARQFYDVEVGRKLFDKISTLYVERDGCSIKGLESDDIEVLRLNDYDYKIDNNGTTKELRIIVNDIHENIMSDYRRKE